MEASEYQNISFISLRLPVFLNHDFARNVTISLSKSTDYWVRGLVGALAVFQTKVGIVF